MADKELGYDQKPPKLAAPSGKAAEAQANQGPNAGAYYLNVAQKGKLIIPTALWLLMILGAICFVCLLGSLNKTVSNLDELVEIEAKQAELLQEELEVLNKKISDKHHDHGHLDQILATDSRTSPVLEDPELPPAPRGPLDWLSMPSWTSLEPKRPAVRHLPVNQMVLVNPDEPEQIVDDIVSKMMQPPAGSNGPMPISGIVITSDDSAFNGPADSGREIFDNVFKQIFQTLGSGLQASGKPASREENMAPKITANIDKININIHNSHEPSDRRRPSKAIPENDNSLEKSIDVVVSKLMDSPDTSGPALDLLLPQVSRPSSNQQQLHSSTNHDHHMLHPFSRRRPPLSPLASLLMPLELESGPLSSPGLLEPVKKVHPGPTSEPQFIIAFDGPDEPISGMLPLHNPAPHRHHHHKHGMGSPPYEISNKELDLPSNNPDPLDGLAETIAQILPQMSMGPSLKKGSDEKVVSAKDGDTVVFINRRPIKGEDASSENNLTSDSSDDVSSKSDNSLEDVFKFFFGPEPDVAGSPLDRVEEQSQSSVSKNETKKEQSESSESGTSVTEGPKQSTLEKEPERGVKNNERDIDEGQKVVGQILEGVLNTLPVFEGQPAPEKIESSAQSDTTTSTAKPAHILRATSAPVETTAKPITYKPVEFQAISSVVSTSNAEKGVNFDASSPVKFADGSAESVDGVSETKAGTTTTVSPAKSSQESTPAAVLQTPTQTPTPRPFSTTLSPSDTQQTSTKRPISSKQTITTTKPEATSTLEHHGNITTTAKPTKTFLQKADDFIGRNIFNFRRLLHT